MNHLAPCLRYRRLRITPHQAYTTGAYKSPRIGLTLPASTHRPRTGLMLPALTHHFISISISIRESPSHPIREGEKGASAVWVGSRLFSCFARMHARVGFLIWGKKAHGEARGQTFLPFYSAEIGFLSEKRCEVARPQRETRISIENGNQVARPPCQTFHSRIFIQKGNAVARPPSQIL